MGAELWVEDGHNLCSLSQKSSLLPALHLPLQRFPSETLGGVRRTLQQGLSMQDGFSVWFSAHCLLLPSLPDCLFFILPPSEPLHFCSSFLSFLISVVEQNCLFFDLNSLADQHWSSGHNPSPCPGMVVITGMRWNLSPWWNFFSQILFPSLCPSLFSKVAFAPVQPVFLSYHSHTPIYYFHKRMVCCFKTWFGNFYT